MRSACKTVGVDTLLSRVVGKNDIAKSRSNLTGVLLSAAHASWNGWRKTAEALAQLESKMAGK